MAIPASSFTAPIHRRLFHRLAVWCLVCLALSGCSSESGNRIISTKPFAMGEKIRVGALTFTVLDASWKSQLGEGAAAKVPAQRFLLVKLAVTNSAASEAGMPYLTLEDSKGQSFREYQEGAAIPQWLGVFRRIQPAQTEEGQIAFDVAPNSYKLRLSDGAEQESSAYVDIPLDLRP